MSQRAPGLKSPLLQLPRSLCVRLLHARPTVGCLIHVIDQPATGYIAIKIGILRREATNFKVSCPLGAGTSSKSVSKRVISLPLSQFIVVALVSAARRRADDICCCIRDTIKGIQLIIDMSV